MRLLAWLLARFGYRLVRVVAVPVAVQAHAWRDDVTVGPADRGPFF